MNWLRDLQQRSNHPFDKPLSTLLLRYLEPSSVSTEEDEHFLSSSPDSPLLDTSSIAEWEAHLNPPEATCILSESNEWPFDLQDSTEALDWVLRRVLERLTLKRMNPESTMATFPPPSNVKTAASSIFGPLDGLGLSIRLKSCSQLSPEIARLSVATRERWLQYLYRQKEDFHVTCFPPLTHAVGVMVGHREFTDEVAMDLYGAFDCAVDVMVESPGSAQHGHKSSAGGEASSSLCPPIAFSSLNGLTVLFIACLILRAESSVHKLLDMEVTGLVILRDMAEYGLGWLMQERDARSLIKRWCRDNTAQSNSVHVVSKLSLFLDAWMRCHDIGPFASHPPPGIRGIEDLIEPALQLSTMSTLLTSFNDNERSLKDHDVELSGILHGCATGTATVMLLEPSSSTPAHKKGGAHAWNVVENLCSTAQKLCGNEHFISGSALATCKQYLAKLLQTASAETIQQVYQPHTEVCSRLTPSAEKPCNTSHHLVFYRSFYRSFFVSITGGRLRYDGGWNGSSLKQDINRKRRDFLGIDCSENQARPRSTTTKKALTSISLHLLIVSALSLTVAVVTGNIPCWGIPSLAAEVSPDAGQWMGIGQMRGSHKAGKSTPVKGGEMVQILDGAIADGRHLVRTPQGNVKVSHQNPHS